MAELPRYQQTGLLPGDTTRLDFANVKESISMSKGIQSSLDRMSTFAFKEAAEKAQREGAQYGAENQPGVEQVMLAIEEGKSPGELFVKPGTYFGDAARKVQATQLRTELEVRGRQDLARLSATLDAGPVDMKEVTTQIKGLTDGFSKALASIDPEESLRFRASMATAGNAVYTKATEKAAKIYQEGLQILAGDSLAATSTILSDTLTSESDPLALQERFNVERSRVYEVAKQTGDPAFVKSTMDAFDKKRLNAIVDYVTKSDFAPTPMAGLRRLESKDFGKLSNVMQSVDMDKLRKQYVERAGETATLWKRSSELKAAENIDLVNNTKDDIWSGKISGQEGYNRIKSLGVTLPDEERKAFLHGDFAGANPQVYGEFESMADKGNLGEEVINTYAKAGVISWKQANGLKKIARGNEQDMSRARQFVQNSLGVPDITMPGFGQEKARVAEINTQLAKEKQEALNAGLPFNSMDRAMELISDKKTTLITEGKKASRESLKKKTDELKIEYREDYTDETLKRLGVKSEDDRRRILRITKEIQR
jgi:hypothetical protein